jgi:peptide/nickel transport system permease protein
MFRYVIRRIIQAIPTFFGITILAFLLMTQTPGGPAGVLCLNAARSGPEGCERIKDKLGLNDPFYVQYLRWLIGDDWLLQDTDNDGLADKSLLVPLDRDGDGVNVEAGTRKGVLRGDFGLNQQNRPVLDVLIERLPATLELSVSSFFLGAALGILVGVLAAVQRGGVFDNSSRVFAVLMQAVPNFWMGLLLLYFLAYQTRIFPISGRCATTISDSCPPIYERLEYMVLPIIVLSAGLVAGYSRFMRASMLDVINQDYIRTARSKGLSDRSIWMRHGLRNALIPIATFIGPALTSLLAGAIITETIFNYPGVGRVTFAAFTQRDYNVVMAVTIYASLATIIGFLISDILYGLIDPRIRY